MFVFNEVKTKLVLDSDVGSDHDTVLMRLEMELEKKLFKQRENCFNLDTMKEQEITAIFEESVE